MSERTLVYSRTVNAQVNLHARAYTCTVTPEHKDRFKGELPTDMGINIEHTLVLDFS